MSDAATPGPSPGSADHPANRPPDYAPDRPAARGDGERADEDARGGRRDDAATAPSPPAGPPGGGDPADRSAGWGADNSARGGAAAAVLAVAALAFRESARSRVLYALVGAMLLACACSFVLAWVSGGDADPGRRDAIVIDLSLSALTFLGVVAAIFLGTNLVYQEVERRTVHTILSRPIGRAGFVLGKYLGLAGVLGAAVLAMGGGFVLLFLAGGGTPNAMLLLAIAFVYVELLVVIGVALFFSVAAHPIEGAVFAFVVALAGHVTGSLNELAAELVGRGDAPAVLETLLYVVYVLLPNLENFNLRAEAAYQLPVEPARVLFALLYALLYTVAALAATSLVFRRKTL